MKANQKAPNHEAMPLAPPHPPFFVKNYSFICPSHTHSEATQSCISVLTDKQISDTKSVLVENGGGGGGGGVQALDRIKSDSPPFLGDI